MNATQSAYAGKASGAWRAFALSMSRTYSLVRPIFGFWEDIGQVVTIPAGAKIRQLVVRDEVGLCVASWDGRRFLAFGSDIRENAISVERVGDLPQNT